MKYLKLILTMFLLSLFLLSGCNKDDTLTPEATAPYAESQFLEDSTAFETIFSNSDLVATYTGIVIREDSLRVGPRGGEEGLSWEYSTFEDTMEVSQVSTDSIMLTRPNNAYWSKTMAMQDDLHFSEGYPYYDGFQTYDLRFSEFPHDSLIIEIKTIYDTNYRYGFENLTYKLARE